eukprot:9226062-Pyramimonas_sp.AAC.1
MLFSLATATSFSERCRRRHLRFCRGAIWFCTVESPFPDSTHPVRRGRRSQRQGAPSETRAPATTVGDCGV